MQMTWKENWSDTRKHLVDWWSHEGLVISHWGTGMDTGASLYNLPPVPEADSPRAPY